jgi:hypothetical protein
MIGIAAGLTIENSFTETLTFSGGMTKFVNQQLTDKKSVLYTPD